MNPRRHHAGRRPGRSLVGLGLSVVAILALGGCWEWDIFVPENPNACGMHVPPITGALTVSSFTLIDVASAAAVPGFDPIAPGAVLNLATLPAKLNVRANTVPAVVGGVVFSLDAAKMVYEFAPPYMLGGDTCGSVYGVWPVPAAGSHILTGTALRGTTNDSERGGSATLMFTVQR